MMFFSECSADVGDGTPSPQSATGQLLFKTIFTRLVEVIDDARDRPGSRMLGRMAVHDQYCYDAFQAKSQFLPARSVPRQVLRPGYAS
jgi:hypothetical protein